MRDMLDLPLEARIILLHTDSRTRKRIRARIIWNSIFLRLKGLFNGR